MVEQELQTIDRYKGCLIGGAVGDALGAPAEFLSTSIIKQEFGVLKEMVGGGGFGWKLGETTDDTDNVLCIVNSLVEKRAYDPEDIARRLLEWYKSNPKDIGNTTRISLSLLEKGTSWRHSGRIAIEMGASEGNGSLMRTHPLGLYFRGEQKLIDKAADDISAITHASSDCLIACRIASHLVACLATGMPRNESIDYLKDMYPSKSEHGFKLRKVLDGRYNNSSQGYVLGTLGIALTAFLDSESFENAVTVAANFGGDTDTQACVTGAIAGAYWGNNEIPERWKSKLNPVGAEEFEMKAEKLYHLNQNLHNQ